MPEVDADRRCNRIVAGRNFRVPQKNRRSAENTPRLCTGARNSVGALSAGNEHFALEQSRNLADYK